MRGDFPQKDGESLSPEYPSGPINRRWARYIGPYGWSNASLNRSGLLPVHGAFHGTLPASIELFALIRAHFRLECAVNGPMLGNFLLTTPEASCQTSKICSTKGCRLGNR